MTRTIHDYQLLERQYITTDVSIRQLCEQNGIKNWSTVNQQAKKRQWERKRAEYKEAQFQHDINALAQRRAIAVQETVDDGIRVIHAAFLKMAQNMEREDYIVTPTDLSTMIKSLSLLTGGPTSREEVRNLNLNGDLPPELLRELARAARDNGAGAGPMGESALPVAPGPRQVN